jgi:hypothetical protein
MMRAALWRARWLTRLSDSTCRRPPWYPEAGNPASSQAIAIAAQWPPPSRPRLPRPRSQARARQACPRELGAHLGHRPLQERQRRDHSRPGAFPAPHTRHDQNLATRRSGHRAPSGEPGFGPALYRTDGSVRIGPVRSNPYGWQLVRATLTVRAAPVRGRYTDPWRCEVTGLTVPGEHSHSWGPAPGLAPPRACPSRPRRATHTARQRRRCCRGGRGAPAQRRTLRRRAGRPLARHRRAPCRLVAGRRLAGVPLRPAP